MKGEDTMHKCYAVTIEDKVHDIGFRGFIENIARSNYLEGIVFNDKDGSVKAIIRGDSSVINDFFDEIKIKGNRRGIVLNITDKKELILDIPLPPVFTKVNTDDDIDIGRKLDKGNELLRMLVEGQNTLIEGQNTFIKGQNTFIKGQNGIKDVLISMNNTLQKIAEK